MARVRDDPLAYTLEERAREARRLLNKDRPFIPRFAVQRPTPRNKKCHKCGKRGHVRAECSKKAKRNFVRK
jgi:hypothetical protein